MVTDIDSDKIDEILNSEGTWVIDFWGDWCDPCKKLAPKFEDVAKEVDTNFGKVDMGENSDIGTQFGVRALPTLLIVKDGEEVARTSGNMEKEELQEWIESNL